MNFKRRLLNMLKNDVLAKLAAFVESIQYNKPEFFLDGDGSILIRLRENFDYNTYRIPPQLAQLFYHPSTVQLQITSDDDGLNLNIILPDEAESSFGCGACGTCGSHSKSFFNSQQIWVM